MIQKFWNSFLMESGRNCKSKGTICFGESLDMANVAAKAAANGEKTVMTYPENGYRTAMKGMPSAGDMNIVVNWAGEPVCVIETIKVHKMRFADVNETVRCAECISGDWTEIKVGECKHEMEELGFEFDEGIMLIAEEFRAIYPA